VGFLVPLHLFIREALGESQKNLPKLIRGLFAKLNRLQARGYLGKEPLNFSCAVKFFQKKTIWIRPDGLSARGVISQPA
jgi:hypothetical protein